MVKEITATNAKNKFGDVLHDVLNDKEDFLVTRNGRPVAYIIPVKEYLAFQLGTSKELADFKKGAESDQANTGDMLKRGGI